MKAFLFTIALVLSIFIAGINTAFSEILVPIDGDPLPCSGINVIDWVGPEIMTYIADDGSEYWVRYYKYTDSNGITRYQITEIIQYRTPVTISDKLLYRLIMLGVIEKDSQITGKKPQYIIYDKAECVRVPAFNPGDQILLPIAAEMNRKKQTKKDPVFASSNFVTENIYRWWVSCDGVDCCSQKYKIEWDIDPAKNKLIDVVYLDNKVYSDNCPTESPCEPKCDDLKFNWNETEGFTEDYRPPWGVTQLSVDGINGNYKLKITPNPSSTNINIEHNNKYVGELTVIIYNNLGLEIYSNNFNKTSFTFKTSLDLNNFPSGNYTLYLNYSGKRIVKTFAVIK